jgi:hypothetical protein
MTVWRFTGYYRTPRERAQRWNWRCTIDGETRIASMRAFGTFAECLADAREHGYAQQRHQARFDRRYESDVLFPGAERRIAVPAPRDPQGDRRRTD